MKHAKLISSLTIATLLLSASPVLADSVTETPTAPLMALLSDPVPTDPSTPVTPPPTDPVSPTDPSTPVTPTPTDPSTPVTPTPTDPSTPVTPPPTDPVAPVDPTTPIDPVDPTAPTEPIAPTPTKPVTPTIPSPQAPITSNTGHTVIGTQNGQVVTSDGQVLDAPLVGGKTNEDGTISLKTDKGEVKILPHTGEHSGLVLTILGGLALFLGAIMAFKKTKALKDEA
ncbi:LPXTG cell wall anchor domain-containing protein [Streptococcus agalactiae]|uniref:LPXTG cell wall anchor domain-containing protein n=1 Tax=Streptococcus agalactiae TaxID=1311 RepID=UPI0013039A1A|nr:LPXTG cell wall anchor domain-containing protein [Streptococcus agalactiae]KAF0052060.1 LPXTG cell wall anchor domain-containing protein [Streptococcus agalactiae]